MGVETVPGCLYLADNIMCGATYGHDGPHLPFVPGNYLRPPALHPLDLLRVTLTGQCPVCIAPLRGAFGESATVFPPAGRRPYTMTLWTFGPCGCTGRTTADLNEEEMTGGTSETG